MVHGVSVGYFYSVRSTANQYEVSVRIHRKHIYCINTEYSGLIPDAALAFTTPFSPRELGTWRHLPQSNDQKKKKKEKKKKMMMMATLVDIHLLTPWLFVLEQTSEAHRVAFYWYNRKTLRQH
jgi:hypothetical protein